jgi:hypothetical protein
MRFIARLFRRFIAKPVMETRGDKPPIANFSKFQFWAYPELCRKQLYEALSHCDQRSRESQLAVAQAYFGRDVAQA